MARKKHVGFLTRLKIKKGLHEYNIGVKTGRIRKPRIPRKKVE